MKFRHEWKPRHLAAIAFLFYVIGLVMGVLIS